MNIAVIPARGGSKRIPRKNIKPFANKPMIAHAITAAKASGLFSHVVVSTDDEEIAAIAREWGAETPFMRPEKLADDHTTTVPVIAHAIEECRKLGWTEDYVCCIYPGVPFIQIEDLFSARELLIKTAAQYCFPVAEFPSPIQRAFRRLDNEEMQLFSPEHVVTRTQDLEPSFFDAGQFYWGTSLNWTGNKTLHENAVGFSIPILRVVDIDTMEDWQHAERLYRCFQIDEGKR